MSVIPLQNEAEREGLLKLRCAPITKIMSHAEWVSYIYRKVHFMVLVWIGCTGQHINR